MAHIIVLFTLVVILSVVLTNETLELNLDFGFMVLLLLTVTDITHNLVVPVDLEEPVETVETVETAA